MADEKPERPSQGGSYRRVGGKLERVEHTADAAPAKPAAPAPAAPPAKSKEK